MDIDALIQAYELSVSKYGFGSASAQLLANLIREAVS